MGKKTKKKAAARRIEAIASFFRDIAVILTAEFIKAAIQSLLN